MAYRLAYWFGVALLLSAGSAGAASPTQDDFFNDSVLQEIPLAVSAGDWQTLKDNFGEDTYIRRT